MADDVQLHLHSAGVVDVKMRVDESRQDAFAAEVDYLGLGRAERANFVVRAGGDEAVSLDTERRNDGEFTVDGVDLAVHVSSIRSSHESFSSR